VSLEFPHAAPTLPREQRDVAAPGGDGSSRRPVLPRRLRRCLAQPSPARALVAAVTLIVVCAYTGWWWLLPVVCFVGLALWVIGADLGPDPDVDSEWAEWQQQLRRRQLARFVDESEVS
jgi:hypothetical protein